MKYLGNKVGNGLALGKVYIIDAKIPELKEIKLTTDDEITKEKEDLKTIVESVCKDYEELEREATSDDIRELCNFYKILLSSNSLITSMEEVIDEEKCDKLTAITKVMKRKAEELSLVDNAYLKERSKDIEDVTNKLIRKALGIKEIDLSKLSEDTILVAESIPPSVLLSNNLGYVKGIVAEIGGKTSHVAILASTLGIPSVFGIKEVSKTLTDGELIYVNGNEGYIENNLTDTKISEIKEKIKKEELLKASLVDMKDKPSLTKDNKSLLITANAGDLSELDKLLEVNSDGIGLFRTEFLFLNRSVEPEEDYLFNVYKTFAEKLNGKQLIIRTLDIGGDKKCPYIDIKDEQNPFLGYRAIRYCLDNKEFFKVSLRAILRASHYGNVMIMYPMISSLEEIYKANEILDEAKRELASKNIPFDENIKVGIMVEVPSTAVMADMLIDEVDFFSIGTNDLIQYTVAVDRLNPTVSNLYSFYNPGVIRLIKKTIDSAKDKKDKFVGMCGEMAADPLAIILLVGLGLQEFSVNASMVLKAKKLISMIDSKEAKIIADKVLTLKTAKEVEAYLDGEAKKIYGKYY